MLTREMLLTNLSNPKSYLAMRTIGRALIVLNERQTRDEQLAEQTQNHNGVGFRPCDARMGTSMAKQYAVKNSLSEKQIAYWCQPNVKGVPRIAVYFRQLAEAAVQKEVVMQAATSFNYGNNVQ